MDGRVRVPKTHFKKQIACCKLGTVGQEGNYIRKQGIEWHTFTNITIFTKPMTV